MIVSINQPAYLPWLGYFDRIARSDVHIVLDHVQYKKNSMINRNKIRTATGWTWLTVPVLFKGKFNEQPISTLEISPNAPGCCKHWRSIEQNYRKAPYFEKYAPEFANILNDQWSQLCPLITTLNAKIMEILSLDTKMIHSSHMDISSTKSDLILDLCKATAASTYISGPFGRDYLDMDVFATNGIEILFQDYDHPTYSQLYGGFEPYMSVIDLIFNCGDEALDILSNGEKGLSKQ